MQYKIVATFCESGTCISLCQFGNRNSYLITRMRLVTVDWLLFQTNIFTHKYLKDWQRCLNTTHINDLQQLMRPTVRCRVRDASSAQQTRLRPVMALDWSHDAVSLHIYNAAHDCNWCLTESYLKGTLVTPRDNDSEQETWQIRWIIALYNHTLSSRLHSQHGYRRHRTLYV